jgi:hypothetical protein
VVVIEIWIVYIHYSKLDLSVHKMAEMQSSVQAQSSFVFGIHGGKCVSHTGGRRKLNPFGKKRW